MKRITIYILLLIPVLVFGQLYPSFKDYNGSIDKVVIRDYGRDIEIKKLFGKYHSWYIPGIYSGGKHIYFFDSIGNIAIEKHYKKRKLTDGKYQKIGSSKNRIIEKIPSYIEIYKDYDEYEFQYDTLGRKSKVNYWVFIGNNKRLEMVDEYIKYNDNRLISFTRYKMNLVNFKMDYQDYMVYKIKYDTLGRISSFEKWECIPYENMELNDSVQNILNNNKDNNIFLAERLTYTYNSLGFIIKEKDDFFDYSNDITNNNINSYSFYYKYDKQGNWIKMYSQHNNEKKGIERKRRIRYK